MSGHNACFRCGQATHWVANCPWLIPASTFADHMARITAYVDRWADGLMRLEEKRVAISFENQLWYGDKCPRNLTYP